MQAQLRLAELYERGDGVPQSFAEAERWYRSAAEQGSVGAQARLGQIFLTRLAPPDTATAAARATFFRSFILGLPPLGTLFGNREPLIRDFHF